MVVAYFILLVFVLKWVQFIVKWTFRKHTKVHLNEAVLYKNRWTGWFLPYTHAHLRENQTVKKKKIKSKNGKLFHQQSS